LIAENKKHVTISKIIEGMKPVPRFRVLALLCENYFPEHVLFIEKKWITIQWYEQNFIQKNIQVPEDFKDRLRKVGKGKDHIYYSRVCPELSFDTAIDLEMYFQVLID
jgi:hypothetical protein